ncbi:metallophosphoesterase family protein [Sinomicrobium oceani]|uniref:metallophosphoesterase family protein n=1 Tax=Sinomicrobium oceani TaxID=1150368 RepID=UPI00227BDF94|nr:metallophosphoesterase [Sinomicrobium oceani]
MRSYLPSFLFFLLLFPVPRIFSQSGAGPEATRIAFLADVHLQDLYGTFTDTGYRGIINPETGKYTLLRTMGAQLHSTRIFNENYFAFLTALQDIAARGIRLVALPGDYSDDGQPIHVNGLRHILDHYSGQYGMQFFITTGNHDPVGPFRQEAGKSDFLGAGGKNQLITSIAKDTVRNTTTALPPVFSRDIAKSGYADIMKTLEHFGFYPSPDNLYWATPFSTYTPDSYTIEKAREAGRLQNRMYDVLPGYPVPDASYVVEPVPGLWLLALDGDVHIPEDPTVSPEDAGNYSGAGTGYKNVLSHKQHLIGWVKEITTLARKYHKTLIAFSHFPMIDFNDDASPLLEKLFGGKKWQLGRVPPEAVAETFAKAGLRVHVGGHMHINDTGIRNYDTGDWLVNIQSPSPAAYMPGYKILTIHDEDIEVETVSLSDVTEFRALFPLYETEYEYLQNREQPLWDKSILRSKTYKDFTLWHLRELVRLRFLKDWPEELREAILARKGTDFIAMISNPQHKKELRKSGLRYRDFRKWDGRDLLYDFYKLRNADELAFADIPEKRIAQYNYLAEHYRKLPYNSPLHSRLQLVFECLHHFLHGAPAAHFRIDMVSGTLKALP